MTTSDPIGTALTAIGAGSTTGATIMTAGVITVRGLQSARAGPDEWGAFVLTASLLGGIMAAVASGWIRTASIDDYWRRGVTAAVAVLGSALCAVAATLVDQFTGLAGLAVYGVVLTFATIRLHATASRLGRS